VAEAASVDVVRWQVERAELMSRIGPRFARESWRLAVDLVAGLMSDLPRKNCWAIAGRAGHDSPDGLQYLLARASWDHDGVRDDVRDFVVAGLGNENAVLVVDETGDLKKGAATVGVQRQYTGTAGRVESAQVAVHLTYTTEAGHAFIDAELYLPELWTSDPERLAAAGVPAEVGFATKPELAKRRITRALDAGVPAAWVAGDEVYGASTDLRSELEKRQLGYVLVVGCDHRITTRAGALRADKIAATLPRSAWQRLSAGNGAKGKRWYHWALIDIADPSAGHRWLLIRRNLATGEVAYFRCYSPAPVPLRTLVRTAGLRGTVEESFQAGKGLCGLDEHQVRRWVSWRRWTILAVLAFAYLAIQAAQHRSQPPPGGLAPLTCNEICHLINNLTRRPHNPAHSLHWSTWRQHTSTDQDSATTDDAETTKITITAVALAGRRLDRAGRTGMGGAARSRNVPRGVHGGRRGFLRRSRSHGATRQRGGRPIPGQPARVGRPRLRHGVVLVCGHVHERGQREHDQCPRAELVQGPSGDR